MTLTILDAVLLIVLAGFVFYGLFFGLIKMVGNLLGIIIGAFLASHYYLQVFSWAESFFMGYDNLGKVATFLILFGLANRLVGIIFSIIDSAFNLISIIPFLKTINRFAGAVLGFLVGALIIGLILYVTSRYAILGHLVGNIIAGSKLAPFLVKSVNVLTPLFPEAFKMLESVI